MKQEWHGWSSEERKRGWLKRRLPSGWSGMTKPQPDALSNREAGGQEGGGERETGVQQRGDTGRQAEWQAGGQGWRAWHGMAEVREGAPVAVSGWVLTDGHDLRPCAASSLHRVTMSVSNVIGGTRNSAWRRHETQSTMLMLGSTSCAPKEPCPSVSSPEGDRGARRQGGRQRRKRGGEQVGRKGMAWHGMADVHDGCLAAEASRSSFGQGQCHQADAAGRHECLTSRETLRCASGHGTTRHSMARTESVPLHWAAHGSRFSGGTH